MGGGWTCPPRSRIMRWSTRAWVSSSRVACSAAVRRSLLFERVLNMRSTSMIPCSRTSASFNFCKIKFLSIRLPASPPPRRLLCTHYTRSHNGIPSRLLPGDGQSIKPAEPGSLIGPEKLRFPAKVRLGERREHVAADRAAFDRHPPRARDLVAEPDLAHEIAGDRVGVQPGEGDDIDQGPIVGRRQQLGRGMAARREHDIGHAARGLDIQVIGIALRGPVTL